MSNRARRVAAFLLSVVLSSAIGVAQAAAPPTKKKSDKKAPAKKATTTIAATSPKPSPAPALAPIELTLDVRRATLANGLRVVLNPDHASPTVAIAVTYDVGSRDDLEGKTGFAHLFEHMMFEGSKNVPKGEHAELVYAHGGALDATTDADRTRYFELLPANELALGLWLEADRMKALDVTAVAFENQRRVVEEEYRMRYENVPYRLSTLRLEELVYQGFWPYAHSGIGSMADLEAAKLESVAAFHAAHYGPNTAVLSISGDFAPEEAQALVEKYFGAIPKIETTKAPDPALPEQTSQRSAMVRDVHAHSPMVQYGFPIPPLHAPEHDALEVVAELLAGGESSRLHQLLVRDKAVAQSARAGTRDRRGPDLFAIEVKLTEGAKVADVEKLVEAELKALGTKPPPADELVKAKRRLQTAAVLDLQSNLARASELGKEELFFGDATLLNKQAARTFAVTGDDVRRAAERWLGPLRRTVVETTPPEGEAKPAPKPVAAAPAKAATPAKKPGDKDKKATDKKSADKKKPLKKVSP